MSSSRKYMAASVPRYLRTTRLAYLPLHTIIGTRYVQGAGGAHVVFDVVMLEAHQFQRMKSNVGLQHLPAPALKAGPEFAPAFILADAREVVVPADENDPENYAKNYFLKLFDLLTPETPAETSHPAKEADFPAAAREECGGKS